MTLHRGSTTSLTSNLKNKYTYSLVYIVGTVLTVTSIFCMFSDFPTLSEKTCSNLFNLHSQLLNSKYNIEVPTI